MQSENESRATIKLEAQKRNVLKIVIKEDKAVMCAESQVISPVNAGAMVTQKII